MRAALSEFMQILLADENGARSLEALDDRRVFFRNEILASTSPRRRNDAGFISTLKPMCRNEVGFISTLKPMC